MVEYIQLALNPYAIKKIDLKQEFQKHSRDFQFQYQDYVKTEAAEVNTIIQSIITVQNEGKGRNIVCFTKINLYMAIKVQKYKFIHKILH